MCPNIFKKIIKIPNDKIAFMSTSADIRSHNLNKKIFMVFEQTN